MPTLAELTEDAAAYTPLWPGIERVEDPRFCVLFLEWLTFVQRLRVDGEVEQAVADVRALAAAHGRSRTLWWLGCRTEPTDLPRRLLGAGLRPFGEGPLLGMALDRKPDIVLPSAEVRRVESLEDYVTALAIEHEVQGVSTESRASTRRQAGAIWNRIGRSDLHHYLAYLDGEPVAMGRAAIGEAVFLMGGATLPRARGRGAYASLIKARWEDGGGRPLVAQASTDSQPILAKLGFRETGEIHILADEGEG